MSQQQQIGTSSFHDRRALSETGPIRPIPVRVDNSAPGALNSPSARPDNLSAPTTSSPGTSTETEPDRPDNIQHGLEHLESLADSNPENQARERVRRLAAWQEDLGFRLQWRHIAVHGWERDFGLEDQYAEYDPERESESSESENENGDGGGVLLNEELYSVKEQEEEVLRVAAARALRDYRQESPAVAVALLTGVEIPVDVVPAVGVEREEVGEGEGRFGDEEEDFVAENEAIAEQCRMG